MIMNMNKKKVIIGFAIALTALMVNGLWSTANAQEPETFNVTIHDSNGGSHTESFELPKETFESLYLKTENQTNTDSILPT